MNFNEELLCQLSKLHRSGSFRFALLNRSFLLLQDTKAAIRRSTVRAVLADTNF